VTLDPIAHAALSNAALNSPHPNDKPLRIAVWLGDGWMQSVLSHAQTDVSKLQQLMTCRIQLDVEDKPLIDEPSDEPTLVALITDQLAHKSALTISSKFVVCICLMACLLRNYTCMPRLIFQP